MLVVSPTSISENGGRATVAATLSNPAPIGGASLTVNASGGSGYSLSPNRTLTFAAGAGFSTGTVTITAEHDADTENETVTVSATVASGGITAPADVTLIIRDDDAPPDPVCDYGMPPPCDDDDMDDDDMDDDDMDDDDMDDDDMDDDDMDDDDTDDDDTDDDDTDDDDTDDDDMDDDDMDDDDTDDDDTDDDDTDDDDVCEDGTQPPCDDDDTDDDDVDDDDMLCPDGLTTVSTGETCPRETCPDGTTTVPNGQLSTCPDQTCPDGTTTVPNGQLSTCPDQTCPDGSTVPNGQLASCPTYGWSGVCYDAQGTTGGGSGLPTSAAAHAAGQAFKASCPVGGISSSVTPTTRWYAAITCNNGNSFTVGPYSSAADASTAGQFALIACSARMPRLNLPADSPVTRAQLESTMRAALAALPVPLTLDDLPSPEKLPRQALAAPSRAGGFATSIVGGRAVRRRHVRRRTVVHDRPVRDAGSGPRRRTTRPARLRQRRRTLGADAPGVRSGNAGRARRSHDGGAGGVAIAADNGRPGIAALGNRQHVRPLRAGTRRNREHLPLDDVELVGKLQPQQRDRKWFGLQHVDSSNKCAVPVGGDDHLPARRRHLQRLLAG